MYEEYKVNRATLHNITTIIKQQSIFFLNEEKYFTALHSELISSCHTTLTIFKSPISEDK